MDPNKAGVSPNFWEKGRLANYTLIFYPVNYEINQRLEVYVDRRIGIPEDFGKKNNSCLGVRGTDRFLLKCTVDRDEWKITLTDLFQTREVKPDAVEIVFQDLRNPTVNEVLSSWRLKTFTWDNYGIDELDAGLGINFFCQFPCATCSLERNDLCFSCYGTSTSKWVYFWEQKCLDNCPAGLYEVWKNITVDAPNIFTCDYCQSPCMTCGDNKTDCLTCIDGYLWYDWDHTCYEQIDWNFPFISSAVIVIVFVWMIDCCFRDTNILHSVVFFLGFVEDACMIMLVYIFANGGVPGDRSLAFVSIIFHLLLNFGFIFIHNKGI